MLEIMYQSLIFFIGDPSRGRRQKFVIAISNLNVKLSLFKRYSLCTS